MLQRHLLVWLVLSSLAAFYWPEVAGTHFDVFTATKSSLGGVIAVTMFCIGSLLPPAEIREVGRNWPAVLAGTAIQYTSMPLLAYVVGHALQFETSLMTGVIMVGCVPGAMASNVLTLMARGNVSYSVCLTTTATLLSPLVVPLALRLTLGRTRELDPWNTSLLLLLQVVLPVLAGYGLCRLSKSVERGMQTVGSTVANLAILWIIAVVVAMNRERLAQVTALLLVGLLAINVLGYAAGYAGGRVVRLPEGMVRALTLEIGMQNAGLGTVLVLQLFDDQTAAIPTAAYTFGCMLTGTLLAQLWSRVAIKSADLGPWA